MFQFQYRVSCEQGEPFANSATLCGRFWMAARGRRGRKNTELILDRYLLLYLAAGDDGKAGGGGDPEFVSSHHGTEG
jgi:hypothetical protein